MFKKAILPLAIIIAGTFTLVMLVVAKPKPIPKPLADAPVNVSVAVVEAHKQQLKLSVKAQGNVSPKREIDLVAQVAGQVVSVTPDFIDGGFFDKAQVLIQIDDRDYQVALLAAKAKWAEADRRLAEERGLSRQAKREWRDLGNQSANDLFVRKPQLAAAQANLDSASGEVEMAKLNLERTKIVVPFSGRIKQTFADLGQYVAKGSRLATVYDGSAVIIRLPLTEKQAALVDLPFTSGGFKEDSDRRLPQVQIMGTVAGHQLEWQGELARMDAFVDSKSRMYFAVVEVANPFAEGDKAPLLPGLFVEAVIEGKPLDNVLPLPREALFERNKILTLDSENKIASQVVHVLRKSAEQVWVQADIADKTLISIEKQSLTPVGTLVDPLLQDEGSQKALSNVSNTITVADGLKD